MFRFGINSFFIFSSSFLPFYCKGLYVTIPFLKIFNSKFANYFYDHIMISKFADYFYGHMMISKFAIKKLLKKEDAINHYNDKLQNPFLNILYFLLKIQKFYLIKYLI